MADKLRAKAGTSHPGKSMRERVCLRCDQTFLSQGPNNRLCPACREYMHAQPTPEEEYSLGYLSHI